ncbi:MAG: ion transporter [Hyphomicrobiales bacterium]|nr:ion transporter [Hyphomicrobiales bacterium]
MAAHRSRSRTALRRRWYALLEQGPIGDRSSMIVDRVLVTLIIVNLLAVVLESVPELAARYGFWFEAIEIVSLLAFTLEYLLRLWVAVEHRPYRHQRALQARWHYATSAAGIVDLIAILPFWFAPLLPPDLRALVVIRAIRFLKIARYSPAMRSLLEVIYREQRALFGCVVILVGATVIVASIMHIVEGKVQPDKLGTIPDAMWWAIVTLGTIGYGDIVPVTAVGKLVAGATIFIGLIMVALPVGIIASGFAEEIHRRDFVVTWEMVARVPLFAELDAAEIGDVMRLLRAQQVEPGSLIARRGDPAHSMYFVAQGEVEIELPHERVRLGLGHFFGEIAVLRRARRSANVVAISRTSLLVLESQDFHALMERDARLAKRVQDVVRSRLGRELVTPQGDIVTEEMDEAEVVKESE